MLVRGIEHMKKRIFGLDLVRTTAIFLVVLVHSFFHSGYNSASMTGIGMFSLLLIRCLANSGVLIFIILTGYLKCNKGVDKNHYKGIIDIIITYLFVSILTIIVRKFLFHDNEQLINYIIGIFSFKTIPYAWYVEMYLGLFFFIPFLNILYKNIDSKKKKQLLIITLFLFTSLFPTLSRIKITEYQLDFYPDWWIFLYPVLLYYIGAYIREYKVTFNKWINLFVLLFTIFLDGVILYYYLSGNSIVTLLTTEYYTFSIIISTLTFLLLYNIDIRNKIINKIVSFLSKVSFGTYLVSYCFDIFVYNKTISLQNSHYYFFICAILLSPVIFLASSIFSYFVSIIVKYIRSFVDRIFEEH